MGGDLKLAPTREGNMNCERYEAKLIAYMDGRASEAERREVDLHLVACADCRARVEEFARLWTALEEAPAMDASPVRAAAFDARLRARIAEESQQSWFTRLLGSWVPQPRLVFALAALLILAGFVGNQATPPTVVTAADVQQVDENVQKMKAVLDDYERFSTIDLDSAAPPEKPEPQRKL